DTGGRYDAATIRYRINVYTPQGEKVDTLSLTGYGSALAQGLSSGKPLERATLAAMRDAAAKFLVQFPQQALAQQLAHDEPLTVQQARRVTGTPHRGQHGLLLRGRGIAAAGGHVGGVPVVLHGEGRLHRMLVGAVALGER